MSLSLPPPTPLPPNVKVLGLASLLNDVASEMIYPLLPAFLMTVLGGTRVHLGIMEGIAESLSSFLKLFSGGWSDRAGRRKGFVVIGYALAGLTRPVLAVLVAPWQLVAARLVDRLGKGIRTAPRDALIADSTPPERRGLAFGFHRAMDHLGAAIGPLLAAAFLYLWPGELRTLFLITLVPGLLVLALLIFRLREPAPTQTNAPLRLTLQPFGWDFRLFLLALLIFTLGNSSDAFLLVRAGELGVPLFLLPVLWTVFHVAKSSGNLLAGLAADRIGPKPLMVLGWCIYAAVYLAFAMACEAWHAWVLFLGYAVYYALTEPAEKKLVAMLAGSAGKGLAYGWFHLAIGIAALPASVLFGWLYEDFGPLAAFGSGAGLALLAAALLVFVRHRPQAPQT